VSGRTTGSTYSSQRHTRGSKIGSWLRGQVPLALNIDAQVALGSIGRGTEAENDTAEGGPEIK
jgi:hypothetical protein